MEKGEITGRIENRWMVRMSFRSVGKVDIKSETSIPSISDNETRSVSKMEFTVEDTGAVIRGPRYYFNPRLATKYPIKKADGKIVASTFAAMDLARESSVAYKEKERVEEVKDVVICDSRATSLSINSMDGVFYASPSVERFSGHTGTCRILGSKKVGGVPYALKLGDLIRIGSVGVVVCEMNSGLEENGSVRLSKSEMSELKNQYLAMPLAEGCCLENFYDRMDGIGCDVVDRNSFVDKPQCYVCYDDEQDVVKNPLVAPCECKGDTKYIHLNCLRKWNKVDDEDGRVVCAVTNVDGIDACSICKATYKSKAVLSNEEQISLMAEKLKPPYVTFSVVTKHETVDEHGRAKMLNLTNTQFQMSFADFLNVDGASSYETLKIGRATSNDMVLRYRTVSQEHAKLKFIKGKFMLMDSKSSNGTMLYMNQMMELPMGKELYFKMGRTILSLKARKKWTWKRGKENSIASTEHNSNEHHVENNQNIDQELKHELEHGLQLNDCDASQSESDEL